MTNWLKMSRNMPKTLQTWADSDIGWISSYAIRLPPPLPCFLSGCLGWRWRCIPGRHAAISAHASRSRMVALREVLWRAVQVRAWQWQSFFCSFTTQSALQGLKLPCSVMDNTQIHTKNCTQTHTQELTLELSMPAHNYCMHKAYAHTLWGTQTFMHTYTRSVPSHIKIASWTKQKSGRQLLWHETFPWYHFRHWEKKTNLSALMVYFSLWTSALLSVHLFLFPPLILL